MKNEKKLFVGIDVGGTKISAGLVNDDGKIINQKKTATPSKSTPRAVVQTLSLLIDRILTESRVTRAELAGIGIGVPGIVDAATGRIVITVNVGLSGSHLAPALARRFAARVFIGNDVNLGLLGEQWLGAAKGAQNVIGIFPGTGVGGAIISHGKLVTGAHGAAAEFGHVIIDGNGPACSCGNHGCLEAFISRWAIERDIREAIKKGQPTIVRDLMENDKGKIKSGILAEALKQEDPLVTSILKRAGHLLGMECISFRHMYDPECIVLGGGVIEACGDFLLPVVRRVMHTDKFFTQLPACPVVASRLGDDAIILGAVALVRHELFPREAAQPVAAYPGISLSSKGALLIDNQPAPRAFYIRADAKLKVWKKSGAKLGYKDIKRLCKKGPELLIVAARRPAKIKVGDKAREFLEKQGIEFRPLTMAQAVEAYTATNRAKALAVL
jgi:glucokinase